MNTMDSLGRGFLHCLCVPRMRAAPIGHDAGRSGPFPARSTTVEQGMSAPPAYGIAAVVTDGTLRAFCTLCPWWSADAGRSVGVHDYRKSSYARARAELTRHMLTPRHAERRASS